MVKDLLLLKLDIIDKFLDKYRDYNDKTCQPNKPCEKLKKKIDRAAQLIIKVVIDFITRQLKLYERQGWITGEAHDIILDRLQCLNNYVE